MYKERYLDEKQDHKAVGCSGGEGKGVKEGRKEEKSRSPTRRKCIPY